jgi:HSP20 family molecular chaperone IbpA
MANQAGKDARTPIAQSPQAEPGTAVATQAAMRRELVPYRIYSPFALLRDMFERFDFAMPRVDITHADDQVLIQIDLPGIHPEDLEVVIDEYSLELEGEHRELRAGTVVQSERGYGRFVRVIPFHQAVDPSTAEAAFDNGVLEVRVRAVGQRKHERKLPITIVRHHEPTAH